MALEGDGGSSEAKQTREASRKLGARMAELFAGRLVNYIEVRSRSAQLGIGASSVAPPFRRTWLCPDTRRTMRWVLCSGCRGR